MSLLLFFTGAQFRRSGVSRLQSFYQESTDNWEILKKDDEEILKIIKKFLEESG
jgi:hypothetical protein